jgi:hypothetical protein
VNFYYISTALGKMEELLMEMKSDVSRLPGELSKIPSVSTQLKMDEISTISKAAHKETAPVIINKSSSSNVRSGSVITHTHTPAEVMTTSVTQQPHVSSASVISEGLKRHSHSSARSSSPRHSSRRQIAAAVASAPTEEKISIVAGNNIATAATAPVAYATTGGTIQLPAAAAAGTTTIQLPATAATGNTIQLSSGTAGGTIQLPAGSQLLQTADGLVVYQGVQTSGGGVQQAATAQKTATIVQQQQATSGTQSSNNAATYAIGVPTYVDGSGGAAAAVYLQGQTVQLVQVSSGAGQQVVYWPSVVQGGQAVATTQAGAQIAVLSTDANGAPVITID